MGKSITINNVRIFRCKMCGNDITEPLKSWKKKPQKVKNICTRCIQKQQYAKEDAREMAKEVSYTELLQRYGWRR